MKKKFMFIISILILCILFGCGDKVDNPYIECEDIIIHVGESVEIKPISNVKNAKYNFDLEGDIFSINNNVISASEEGIGKLKISIEGYDIEKTVDVYSGEGIIITGPKEVVINESVELKVYYLDVDEDERIIWNSSDGNIARVRQGVVTGVSFGNFTITAKVMDYVKKINLEVVRPQTKELVIEEGKSSINYELGAKYKLNYEVKPEYASRSIELETSDDCIEIGKDMSITAKKLGKATLTIYSKDNEEVTSKIEINVVENEAPVFEKLSDYKDLIIANFGDPVSATQGLRVVDNCDGDITSLVTTVNAEDLQIFGEHEIDLLITDRAGNSATFKRKVNVVWPYKTKFIGHQGCFFAVPNTEEAFIYACEKMHYQALECDIRSTKDGVLVISHDDTFGGLSIAQTNYNELKEATKTASQFGCPQTYYGPKTYTGHICTFDRYLDICKKYNVVPIIELKGAYGMDSGNTSQLPTLMQILKDKGLYDTAVILTSMQPCITFLRNNGYTVKCQYLVNGADSDSSLQFCIDNHCDISVNVTYGSSISDEYIKKYHDAGCEISTWTFTSYCDYDQVQEWIDKGVDYVTCDWHYITENKLVLK